MKLYPFQERGVDFLTTHPRAYLADEMGLGKTIQSIAAAMDVGATSVLVIAPASAVPNWQREWKKHGSDVPFAAVSYASPKLDMIDGSEWDVVILDEAQYVKGRKAKRTLRALKIARRAKRFAWLLSGEPMPNHLGELWPPIRALWPEIPRALGVNNYQEWINGFTYWRRTRYGIRPYAVRNADKLKPHMRRVMLRRKLSEVGLDLPPLRVDVSLLPRDGRLATALDRAGYDPNELLKQIEAEDSESGSISRLRRFLGQYKAPRIADILADELRDRAYSKIVVLYYHKDVGAALREKLKDFGVVGFDGSTSQLGRSVAIELFQTDPSIRVFLAQQTAAGVAINLQAANEIVLVEPAWSPSDNAQAIKRIHRIGQDQPCRARIFAVQDSLDEAIMGVVAQKTRMQAEVGL